MFTQNNERTTLKFFRLANLQKYKLKGQVVYVETNEVDV